VAEEETQICLSVVGGATSSSSSSSSLVAVVVTFCALFFSFPPQSLRLDRCFCGSEEGRYVKIPGLFSFD
jgi:hypothetical protein